MTDEQRLDMAVKIVAIREAISSGVRLPEVLRRMARRASAGRDWAAEIISLYHTYA
jgi:hypothetical protein